MYNLHQSPVYRIVDCVNSLYKAQEIDSEQRSALLDSIEQSRKSNNWDNLRKQLFDLRASSCLKAKIDYAIDATRTGGNVI